MSTIKSWMAELASHYEQIKRRYPQEKLLIMFDIDGTILDMRHMVWYLLQTYDRHHHTDFFANLTVSDICVDESNITPLLVARQVPPEEQQAILTWYDRQAWSSAAMLEAHRPFGGVLEVIRWFQMQPDAYVGLNTARPDSLRNDTLRSLNKLGQEYKVSFTDELLYMRPADWAGEVSEAKVAGIRYFQQQGYRIFAFVDNEPDNLYAVSQADPEQEILLLHADTIFKSQRAKLPTRIVGGNIYDLTELIPRKELPQHIQFVWRGLNYVDNLAQFLVSDVHWGELAIWLNAVSEELVSLYFVGEPFQALDFQEILTHIRRRGKGIKLDLRVGGQLVESGIEQVKQCGYKDADLWFTGRVDILQERGFRQLAVAHPGAIIECPVDFLAPLICSAPAKAREILKLFSNWGINRFSISWKSANLRQFFDQMDQWGFEVNIYDVPNLESFLQAVLLRPRSITSDFNFPKWHFYGRGTQQNEQYIVPRVA